MPGVSTKRGNSAMIWGIGIVPQERIHCALWVAVSCIYWTTWDLGQMLFFSHSVIWMARSAVIGDSAICNKCVNSKDLQHGHFKVWSLSETSLLCCKCVVFHIYYRRGPGLFLYLAQWSGFHLVAPLLNSSACHFWAFFEHCGGAPPKTLSPVCDFSLAWTMHP